MKNTIHLSLLLIIMLAFQPCSQAQIAVNNSLTPAQLAQSLVANSSVAISNVSMTCPPGAGGAFNCINCNVGLASGVVLTTGRDTMVNGPNRFCNTINNASGDNDLGLFSQDACVLEFDLVPTGDSIQLQYVFGSEEYRYYVCSQFNDLFAIFVSGPGITGKRNIALVPGSNIPVGINSINPGTPSTGYSAAGCYSLNYTNYYINNGNHITAPYNASTYYNGYDGLTNVLMANIKNLQANQTYHFKIAIADITDGSYDSGIFLQASSLSSAPSGNDMPNAATDIYTLLQATSLTAQLRNNDSDPDPAGDSICVTTVWGSPYITYNNQCNGGISFNPDSSFRGNDTAYYLLCDNGIPVLCDTGMIIFKVNADAALYPVAGNDMYTVTQATDTTINVTANDVASSSTGNSFCITAVINSSGAYSIVNCNEIVYSPDSALYDNDTAYYVICDNSIPTICDTGRLIFIVTPNPDLFPVAVDDTITIFSGTTTVIDVAGNDSAGITENTFCVVALIADSNFTITSCTEITYTPDSSFTGYDTAYYIICDTGIITLCDTGSLMFFVSQLQATNPIAINDSITVLQPADTLVNVTANDTSGSTGNTFCITAISGSSNFTLTDCNHITFDADSSFIGTDVVTYIICDTISPTLCDTATLTVTVIFDSTTLPPVADFDVLFQNFTCYSITTVNRSQYETDSVEWLFVTQWNTQDSMILYGDTAYYLNMNMHGFYGTACIFVSNAYGKDTLCKQLNYICEGINETSLSNIVLYPNPTSAYITIDMSNNDDEITKNYAAIEIYNVLGEKQKAFARSGNGKTANLNVGELPQGIYVATLLGADGERRVLGKFTKE